MWIAVALGAVALSGCTRARAPEGVEIVAGTPVAADPAEPRLAELRQLTHGGENAEAYWSADGRRLVFQATPEGGGCDQIYTLDLTKTDPPRRVSTGTGRTTCAYFHDGDRRILFASTHAASPECPPPPDRSQGYVWALYDSYDIYTVKTDGTDLRPFITGPGYDAEATVCPTDGRVVFTSTRDGDIDLYVADADGADVRRITDTPGYDGGAFFSRDCSKIVWRASRPEGKDLEDYRALLARGLVRPSRMELWVADGDGANPRQITFNGAANFAPFFFPSGERILFASNLGDPGGRNFDLYAVDWTGANLERVTVAPDFEAFPMFSPDGRHLAFAANRFGTRRGETNVFVARWRADAEVPAANRIATAADALLADIRTLADPAREGRGLGTRGIDEAADFILRRMRDAGLAPAFEGGYGQSFPVVTGVELGEGNALADSEGALRVERDFMPASFSSTGELAGDVVFAGYGISAHDKDWDDYRGVDVRGRVALALRFHPREDDATGPLGPEEARRYSDLRYKAFNAREHGAAALLLVSGPVGHEDEPDTLPRPAPEGPESEAGIPVLFVSRAVADRWLGRQGTSLADEQRRIDAGERNPHLLPLGRVEGRVDLVKKTAETRNLVGVLRGNEPNAGGAVVVGAHYDHLGYGGSASLAPGVRAVHPGADDNASGVAAILAVAEALAKGPPLRRDVVFAAFSAEEVGLGGSAHFVRNRPAAARDILAMVNLDMVGRLRANKLSAIGSGTAAEFPALLDRVCGASPLACVPHSDGFGPSDQTPFYAAGVPVLFLNTGVHDDYHKPSDTADRVNAAGAVKVANVAAAIVRDLADRAEPLALVAATEPPPSVGDARALRTYLGTVPDYGAGDEVVGVRLGGVRPDGPAARAGVRRGDVIVGLGATEIRNLYDYTFALRQHRPDETATLRVRRDGEVLEIPVTFGSR